MSDAIIAESITITGHNGEEIEAYFARPLDGDAQPSVVVLHHMPGYDRATKEIARTFAAYGYAALMPNLHHRYARARSRPMPPLPRATPAASPTTSCSATSAARSTCCGGGRRATARSA